MNEDDLKMDLAIRTEGLTKVYKEVTRGGFKQKRIMALDDLNLHVEKGEVFAFLGPNGAGKTTTIKLLTRLIYPTQGQIWIFNQSNQIRSSMEQVGYLPEQPHLYGHLTGTEFLDFVAQIFGMHVQDRKKRIQALIERVGLGEQSSRLIRGYSRGMVQRLGLAQALINDPDLLILDEPMSNLDPVGRKAFRDQILTLKKQGKTIFFSSHILSDAEMVADRVGILRRGRLINVGKLDLLVESPLEGVEVTFTLDKKDQSRINLDWGKVVIQDQNIMVLLPRGENIPNYLKQIEQWGGKVISVIPQRQSLEDLFMDKIKE